MILLKIMTINHSDICRINYYNYCTINRRPSGKPNEDIKDHVLHTKFEFREKLKDKLKQVGLVIR